MFCPVTYPDGSDTLRSLDKGTRRRYFSLSSFEMKVSDSRFTWSPSRNIQFWLRMRLSRSAALYPMAYSPPTIAPMLVPAM